MKTEDVKYKLTAGKTRTYVLHCQDMEVKLRNLHYMCISYIQCTSIKIST